MTLRFVGGKDPARRASVESSGAYQDGERVAGPFVEYRKTATTFAQRIDVPFEVETIEGVMGGQTGDYLAIGVAGEMYPIAASVFESSYVPTVPQVVDLLEPQWATSELRSLEVCTEKPHDFHHAFDESAGRVLLYCRSCGEVRVATARTADEGDGK